MALAQITIRRGTTAEWAAANPVLGDGEMGYDSTLKRVKVGDGVSSWVGLGWSTMAPGEVQSVLAAATIIDQADTPTDASVANLITTPGSQTNTQLSTAIGELAWQPEPGATAAQNRASLQSAVDEAVASGLILRLPSGTSRIAGGHVDVRGALRVVGGSFGPAATVIMQETRGKAVFKVDAPDCSFSGFTAEGQGLDVTGLPLNGAASFRQHAGIWATLRSHHLRLQNVIFRRLVIGLYVRDFLPGETPAYTAPALIGLHVSDITIDGVWCGVEGGAFVDHSIVGVSGTYGYVTGTPTNGDVGSPPHNVYISSDSAHISVGGFYDRISSTGVNDPGSVLKIKHSRGFTVGMVSAHRCRGILEMEECSDFSVASLVSTEDGYLDSGSAYGRGSAWFVNCKNGLIRGLSITFATGAHGSGLWTNSTCEDMVFERPIIVARRSTPTATVFAMLEQGKRTRIIEPLVRSEGATILSCIAIAGLDQVLRRPQASGAFTNAVSGAARRALIEHDPVDVLPSRLAVPSRSFQVSGAPASEQPIFRNASVGQSLPTGFSDDFNVPGRMAMSWTDDHKRWQVVGLEGADYGTWRVANGRAVYDGGSGRSVAFADAGKADVVITATVGSLPINDEGIALRVQDANNFIAVIPFTGTNDYRVRIVKRLGGTPEQVAISSVQIAAGDVLTITLSGPTVTVAVNGATVASGAVAELATNTRHGIVGLSTGKTFAISAIAAA